MATTLLEAQKPNVSRCLPAVFAEAESGKVLTRWVCSLERDGRRREWRGLDILHVRDGRITEKHTYAKTQRLNLHEA